MWAFYASVQGARTNSDSALAALTSVTIGPSNLVSTSSSGIKASYVPVIERFYVYLASTAHMQSFDCVFEQF